MDSEAASRGTTVYLVDQRIDMLPSLLGTNLCSLRPHVERLAFSAIWVSTVVYSGAPAKANNLIASGTNSNGRNCQRSLHQVCNRFQNGVYLRGGAEADGRQVGVGGIPSAR